MLVVLYCVVNMDLAPERALIQVARVERQQPRDEAAERRNNATVSGNRARPQEHQE